MASAHSSKLSSTTRKKKKSKIKESVEQYTHDRTKRSNNPPVGLVSPDTDPDYPNKPYQYNPRLDPQLTWSGKIERTNFEVDTISLHVHERIDPLTILEKTMKLTKTGQEALTRYFETPENNPPLRDAIDFYKHDQNWSNRLIAGDSLLVMNSLLEKEGLGGKIQMIYIDPPYGIKYGSNFQPFVNQKNVQDGNDKDLTQEPEMIKAFRDTWELGIHSYLSYLRDRVLLAKELLTDQGSIFVQISDENLHHVREIMDEIFGANNFVSLITLQKTPNATSKTLPSVSDYLCWYSKDRTQIKYRDLYIKKDLPIEDSYYRHLEMQDGARRPMTFDEHTNPKHIDGKAKIFRYSSLTSQTGDASIEFEFDGKVFTPHRGSWRTSVEGLKTLASKNRISKHGNDIAYITYFDDFPYSRLNNIWADIFVGFTKMKYVVQTIPKIVERAILMTTDPSDLVLDPTCGGGTTAFVAEKWGRRWIACDTSRVALALTKQRLMTATYDYYKLNILDSGISSGFECEVAPHTTLRSLAHNEQPIRETLYDRPLIQRNKKRISGPFTVEAVPAPIAKSIDALFQERDIHQTGVEDYGMSQQQWRDEMLKSGVRGKAGQRITFSRVQTHPATRWLHADAETKDNPAWVVISFGPKHAPLEQRQVALAIEEAQTLVPTPKMIIFAAMQFDPEAAKDIDELNWPGTTVLKVEMNKDLLTGDLKKKSSSNESFWLMGQPDVDLEKIDEEKYIVRVNGFDYYNTKTEDIESGDSSRIAMWMLDTDYDGRSIYPQQVFFPLAGKDGGWSRLAKTLRAQIDEDLIEKYSGTESIPFEAGPNKRAAVKIIDDRGIESLKIIDLE